jgi:hypothetical protein
MIRLLQSWYGVSSRSPEAQLTQQQNGLFV